MADREFFLLDMRHKPQTDDEYWKRREDGTCEGCPPPCPHTKIGAELMVWWGPNDSGYANSLAHPWVGRYTESRLREAGVSYCQLGKLTLAIPCEAVLPLAVPRPDRFMGHRGSFWCDGPGPVVINHSLMWDLLEPLAWIPEVARG